MGLENTDDGIKRIKPISLKVGLSELLPCPFCGSSAVIKKYGWVGSADAGQIDFEAVSCSNKNCELSSYGISEGTWQTRVS